jgi:hypothetical protein
MSRNCATWCKWCAGVLAVCAARSTGVSPVGTGGFQPAELCCRQDACRPHRQDGCAIPSPPLNPR